MDGKSLVSALMKDAEMPRAPYIPIIGKLAHRLGQVAEDMFTRQPHVQAGALLEVATALHADAITVGVGTSHDVGVSVVERLKPLAGGRAIAACVTDLDIPAARAYCEAGVDMVFVLAHSAPHPGKSRTFANACGFYQVPAIVVHVGAHEPQGAMGLHGHVAPKPTGDEPGIVGGGLTLDSHEQDLVAPRTTRFFWTFAGEVSPDAVPETLVVIGQRLAAA